MAEIFIKLGIRFLLHTGESGKFWGDPDTKFVQHVPDKSTVLFQYALLLVLVHSYSGQPFLKNIPEL
jgi:hypothetical protein